MITRWKYSRIFQIVSTVIKEGASNIQQRVVANKIDVKRTNDIQLYQDIMDEVDRGDQHRVMGTGFLNVAHLKNW